MNAYEATYPTDSRRSEAEGLCATYLPTVQCDDCGETWLDTEVWYPGVSLSRGADPRRFSRSVTVEMAEFQRLRKMLNGCGNRRLRLPPGAGIGPVEARVPANSTDFIWCGCKLLASRRAIRVLRDNGVTLPHGPARVHIRKETISDLYVALELDPIPLYDAATLNETTLVYCPKCGSCEIQDVNADLTCPKRYVKARIPKEQGLVRVNESTVTLASDRLMEVVQSKGITGLEFREEGTYV